MRLRAHHPNRIGSNPVAVKTREVAPRAGRLSSRATFPVPGGVYAKAGKYLPDYGRETARARVGVL